MDNTGMFARFSFINTTIYYGLGLLFLLQLGACSDGLTRLERIQKRGHLRVAIPAAPPMFFPDESMLRGLDYQMVLEYAESTNTKLDVTITRTLGEAMTLLRQGKIHVAITDSIPTPEDDDVRTNLPYNPNKWYVIGNRQNSLPKKLEDIMPGTLIVANDSGPSKVLQKLKSQQASVNWVELPGGNSRQVLEQVNLNRFKLSLINADVFAYYRHLYPEIKIAFPLDTSYPSHWLTLKEEDISLEHSLNEFIHDYQDSGKLEKLHATYFRHLEVFRYVDNVYFLKRIETLLPEYAALFSMAAKTFGFDMRFLAAVSYQESHWDKDARSMTGVRGMMMLTLETAKRVEVVDRLDPEQSIFGGAKYLDILRASLPEDIQEPDRSWMTLAAYNVGLGHLEDARILTEQAGDDPHLWIDVEKHLPKLSEKKWYKQTKHGYARGHEPVSFVRRIHRYFDILRLYQQEELLKKLNTPINYKNLKLSSPIL